MGAPLVDARHLAQRYERIRQEAESQVILMPRLFFYKKISLHRKHYPWKS